ncbi:site-specific DNA-methyltransferase (adenine-specific) [Weissella beninensis]|uniref:Methyltransferase n=1 Tax=Periweissella beninensis TaxID=504936 RepID=A0ABT0VG82_9LACO|nr:site-specific DNA-methyltransferase [Periweissella beninensis]MBM7543769.1 site-specific DNA-methyltransferase (adenine-specific) [Periweissella beninensis]MCM2436847.1 site-specific DNA-methyltransferase [Periweissella beninensis]
MTKNYSIEYHDEDTKLIIGNSVKILKNVPNETFDLIIADPPYFLSNNGFSNSGGKRVSVNKGDWDKNDNPEAFYTEFLIQANRVLKNNGTLWIFGTMHNIYLLGYLLQKNNWKILNNITWQKTNPAPNLSRRMFTHSTETILWVKKQEGRQKFNYDNLRELNDGKQMKDVWMTSTTSSLEKKFGKHPTQKPLALLKRIILASTSENDLILDPFLGSGTTAVAAKLLKRKLVGIDIESEYMTIAKARITNISQAYEGKIT